MNWWQGDRGTWFTNGFKTLYAIRERGTENDPVFAVYVEDRYAGKTRSLEHARRFVERCALGA